MQQALCNTRQRDLLNHGRHAGSSARVNHAWMAADDDTQAPMSGSIPVGVGIASVVRIPVPGTNGLAVELTPRGWTPAEGSSSTLFIQNASGSKHLRLDYGYNPTTNAVDFHWNQRGTSSHFGITDHTLAGPKGEAVYKGARYFKYAGRVLLVVGAAADAYSIVESDRPLRRTAEVAAGWASAWAGCKLVGAGGAGLGSYVGPYGTAAGAIIGCIGGSVAGYEGGEYLGGEIYDWAESTRFTPLPEVSSSELMVKAPFARSPVARHGDLHMCPATGPALHHGGPIMTASSILTRGVPVACMGDNASCVGAVDTIVEGAATVLFEGRPVARVGSLTMHAGRVSTGDATILIGGPSTFMSQSASDFHDEGRQMCIDPDSTELVCIDDSGAVADQVMKPCPPTLPSEHDMEGWRPYPHNPAWFHCGYDGILENVPARPERPMNECFYDESGVLVDENHEYAGCGGTPDQYDGRTQGWDHTWKDEGGIWKAGGPAMIDSIRHQVNETAEQLNEAFENNSKWLRREK